MSSFALNMYLYLLEGTIVCISNGVLAICILGSKSNRKRREFLMIVSQALADTIYAVAFMLIAIHRLRLEAAGKLKATYHRWECALHPALFLHDIATPLLGLVPMAMSINFLVSSVAPLWYITSGNKYTTSLLSVPYLLTAVLLITNYVVLWDDQTPTSALCIAANGAAHPIPYGIMLGMRILANIGSAAVYLAIVIYLTSSQSKSLSSLSNQQRKTHRNAKITLGLVTCNSMVLLFLPDVLLLINPFDITLKYSTILYSMTLSKTTMNFMIYIMRYRELRSILLRSVFGRIPYFKNIVTDSSSVKKPTRGLSQVTPETMAQRRAADTLQQLSNTSTAGKNPERPPARLPPIQNLPKNRS